jgi:hypothetical protein
VAGVGAAVLFVGVYMMYNAYKAIHTHTQATPLTAAKTALKG